MTNKNKFWGSNEFVTFEEYANYGISGDSYMRNLERSEKLGVPDECRCPLCAKPLKERSYRIMITRESSVNGVTEYYYNPDVEGTPMKVGNGCYRNLLKAYNDKYIK